MKKRSLALVLLTFLSVFMVNASSQLGANCITGKYLDESGAGAPGNGTFDPFKAITRAATGKGNFGMGTATRAEADALGRSWVGEGFREMSGGKGLVSADGLRTYRFPTVKSSQFASTGVQANFERLVNGTVVGNGHLNILP